MGEVSGSAEGAAVMVQSVKLLVLFKCRKMSAFENVSIGLEPLYMIFKASSVY